MDITPIDPLTQGFDRIMARFDQLEFRMDNLDRRMDVLENLRLLDADPPDDKFDSDDDAYEEHREWKFLQGDTNP